MGLRGEDLLDDDDRGGCKVSAASVSCSVCLEVVAVNGERSCAKLQCGHEFHLDCIGSTFNIKGAMQCPNCRKFEKGQWLYANGSRPLPEFSFEDGIHDEDLFDLSYSEMSFGLHWCPFTRVPTLFDEGEFLSNAYHELLGPHAVFAEHSSVSSTSHPCPYITYFGPIHQSFSASSGSVSDGSTFNNPWNGPSAPTEVHIPYAFQPLDLHYRNWDQTSAFATSTTQIGGAEQQHLVPPVTQRTGRNGSAILRAGMHPFIIGHGSSSLTPSSIASPVLSTYPHEHPSTLQAYFQQPTGNNTVGWTPAISMARRLTGHRDPAQVGPIPVLSSVNQPSSFYLLSSNASSGNRTFHEADNHRRDPFGRPDRDSIWGPFHSPDVGPDGAIRSASFRHRHGSERMPSQNRP